MPLQGGDQPIVQKRFPETKVRGIKFRVLPLRCIYGRKIVKSKLQRGGIGEIYRTIGVYRVDERIGVNGPLLKGTFDPIGVKVGAEKIAPVFMWLQV